jgi:branched-subunit amino acid transport protein AzlD
VSNFTTTFLTILIAGVAANAIWRIVGVALSSGLSEKSPLILWSQAVSKSLVAGLVARLVLFPPSGALAEVSTITRITAFAVGIVFFYVMNRNSMLGILGGTFVLVVMYFLLNRHF